MLTLAQGPTGSAGELVRLQSSGVLENLPNDTDGKTMKMVSGSPAWATNSIYAADIPDSSSTGRSVLTGTAAQGRTALSVYSSAETDAAIAAAGGGGSHNSGTLAARSTSPIAGDSYEVTSGLCAGDVFECFRDGIWTFVGRGATRRFAVGLGFELVSPGSNGSAGTSVASYESGGVGRLSIATAGTIHDATGCLIRRSIDLGAFGYRASVRLMSRGAFTGSSFGGLYVSDAAGTGVQFIASGFSTVNDQIIAGNWASLEVPGIVDAAPWDGATLLTLQIQNTSIQLGFVRGATWTRWSRSLTFTPAFVGVGGFSDGAASCTYDFADFSLETYG